MATTIQEVQNEFDLTGLLEQTNLTEEERSKISAFPFTAITETYEAGKSYAEKAAQKVTELFSSSPSAQIKVGFKWQNLFNPPYIFFILGGFVILVFFMFKKG